MTTIDRKGVLQGLAALEAVLIARIGNPTVGLQKHSWSEVEIRVCNRQIS